jgi:enterochelin esterase family protein
MRLARADPVAFLERRGEIGRRRIAGRLGAAPQAWVAPRAGVTAGKVEKLRLASSTLGNTREIVLYRPHGYQPGAAGNALAVLFDAETYLSEVPNATILDNLVGLVLVVARRQRAGIRV